MARPCRWCPADRPSEAVTVAVIVERGTPGHPVTANYLCGEHDTAARRVRLEDSQLRAGGLRGIDAIVADLTEVTA